VALSRGPELVGKLAQVKEVINRRRIDPRG
jgi:RpiR family carbohydrate utilization transcriptional regulator